MKAEHERELTLMERMKQQEIDSVTQAFDQSRTVRDLSNRIKAIGMLAQSTSRSCWYHKNMHRLHSAPLTFANC